MADGTIYINTQIDGDGFNSGINSMSKGMGKLSKSLKTLGFAIGSVFAVKELVRFGKEAIELGSNLQEVQNVVETTFTTLTDEVDNFAKAAAKTAGLSETMAKRYVGTFGAMAQAFGFAEENAFDMAKALTQLAGDIASFYNITQDEAYTKLKSIFTGETESLKDLGVVMTQTALDSFAMQKGIGKVTSQMSEQQKVALRYQFVLEQLSTASGDFQRTSDGWANQMRIMNLNIESLKANIGQGLINLFTPLLQVINAIIERLVVLGASFKEFTELVMGKRQTQGADNVAKSVENLGESYGLSTEGIDDFTKSITNASKATKKTLSPLDNLNNITTGIAENLGAAGFGDISIAKADASIDIEGIDKVSMLEIIMCRVADTFGKLRDRIVEIYDKYIKRVFVDFVNDIKEFGREFILWFGEKILPIIIKFKDRFSEIFENNVLPLVGKITDLLGKLWNEILKPFIEWLSDKLGVLLPPILDGLGEAFSNAFVAVTDIVGYVIDALSGLIDFIVGVFTGDWDKAWDGVKETFKGIINALISLFEGFINFVIDGLNGIINGANDLSGVLNIDLKIPNIPKLEIPKLATGAVIPPNAPFMAMLGDQRNGRNLEAPEGLIRQIMRDELAQLSLSKDNRPIVVEISGKEIFRVVQDEADEYFETTGREAFT